MHHGQVNNNITNQKSPVNSFLKISISNNKQLIKQPVKQQQAI